MLKRVSEQEQTDYLYAHDFTIEKDVWDKSGSRVVRKFKDNKSGRILGFTVNWKSYYINI